MVLLNPVQHLDFGPKSLGFITKKGILRQNYSETILQRCLTY